MLLFCLRCFYLICAVKPLLLSFQYTVAYGTNIWVCLLKVSSVDLLLIIAWLFFPVRVEFSYIQFWFGFFFLCFLCLFFPSKLYTDTKSLQSLLHILVP